MGVPITPWNCPLKNRRKSANCHRALGGCKYLLLSAPHCTIFTASQLVKKGRSMSRIAIYARVSTDGQSVNAQLAELREVAERRGWTVIKEFTDAGISGAKRRDQRPALDAMLKAAARGEF